MTISKSLPIPDLSVRDAKLPQVYESAKTALTECSRIDECKEWANKAEALASYARQAGDESLKNTAIRIQARAIQRCGELLREVEAARGGDRGNAATGGRRPVGKTRTGVADEAGLSERQRKTALRVAAIPSEAFEALVESDAPPTVSALAELGKAPGTKLTFDLQGRDPMDFQRSTHAQARLRDLAELCRHTPADVVVRGALPTEFGRIYQHVAEVITWIEELEIELGVSESARQN